MKLKREDKEFLKECGYLDADLVQIETATIKTTYEINGEKISTTKALEALGRKEYLSGIARSAFHWSASRAGNNGKTVLFDSSKLFQ